MITIFTSLISNCAIGSPFQISKKINSYNLNEDSIVVVALTEVETKNNPFNLITFWNHVRNVRDDLDNNPGYLGGKIRKKIFSSKAWTMTVWKDDESIDGFVYANVHKKAMKEGSPAMNRAQFYRIKKKWKEIPMDWEEAIKQLNENGREE